jgi:heat shock protein HslJ
MGNHARRASGATGDPAEGRSDRALTGTEWELARVVGPSRMWSPPPEVDAALRFDGEGHFSATACNHHSGLVRIDGDVLHITRGYGTVMGCDETLQAVEEALLGVVDGEVRWAISGDELRLDKPDGRGLRFRVRDTIYPSRDLRPLLQGQRNGGDYRFGWQASDGLISLEWQWRAGPGEGWGSAGMNWEAISPVPGPDPLIAAAGDDRFVFGVVPAATARVVCKPPAGRSAVPLGLFPLPGVQAWRAFGGFIHQPGGAVVIALDGHGRELGQARRLPS